MNFSLFKKSALFLVTLHHSLNAQPRDPVGVPDAMAALGDSITAGAVAHYKRQTASNPFVELALLFQITQSFLSKKLGPLEARQRSWSTGLDPKFRVTSHAARLEFMSPRQLRVFNSAVSGEDSFDLMDQIDSVDEWALQENNGEFPEYVTLLIGANDVCAANADSMTSGYDFEKNIREAVEAIHERNPHARILMSSLPNIDELKDIAKDAPLLKFPPFKTCGDLWAKINLCPTLTQISDPYERARVRERVKEFNWILNEVAGIRHKTPQEDKIRVANSVSTYHFTPDQLSLDCFHPNSIGQNLISEGTWQESWWSPDWRNSHEKRFNEMLEKNKKVKLQRATASH